MPVYSFNLREGSYFLGQIANMFLPGSLVQINSGNGQAIVTVTTSKIYTDDERKAFGRLMHSMKKPDHNGGQARGGPVQQQQHGGQASGGHAQQQQHGGQAPAYHQGQVQPQQHGHAQLQQRGGQAQQCKFQPQQRGPAQTPRGGHVQQRGPNSPPAQTPRIPVHVAPPIARGGQVHVTHVAHGGESEHSIRREGNHVHGGGRAQIMLTQGAWECSESRVPVTNKDGFEWCSRTGGWKC